MHLMERSVCRCVCVCVCAPERRVKRNPMNANSLGQAYHKRPPFILGTFRYAYLPPAEAHMIIIPFLLDFFSCLFSNTIFINIRSRFCFITCCCLLSVCSAVWLHTRHDHIRTKCIGFRPVPDIPFGRFEK